MFEIHDQKWFPETLRNYVTDALQFILSLGAVYQPIVPRLSAAISSAGSAQVVDLCSGGSGPWLWLWRTLQQISPRGIKVCLTDKFPNISAFERAREITSGQVDFYAHSVDATALPPGLSGFRTIFTSFHHFAPADAVAILQNAVDQKQGIGVFEAARRCPLNIALTVLMLLGGFVTAPFIRPFRWSRLFWTYLIPVIPLVLFYDGIVSCLRAYSPVELRRLIATLQPNSYHWEVGETDGGISPITYMLGYPTGGTFLAPLSGVE